MGSVFYRPGSDITTAGWGSAPAGSLFSTLNEVVPNNATNVFPTARFDSNLVLGLSGDALPGVITGGALRVMDFNTGYFNVSVPGLSISVTFGGVTYTLPTVFNNSQTSSFALSVAQAELFLSPNPVIQINHSASPYYVQGAKAGVAWLEFEIFYTQPGGLSPGFLLSL